MRRSALTDDLKHCFFTGSTRVHIHHIFPGSRRQKSEEYGYIVPLSPWVHQAVHDKPNEAVDLALKQEAQRHYESHIGKRAEFIRIFGRSYL